MSSARILVIEDDEDIRTMCDRCLTATGYEVHTAENGATGLERAVAVRPDVILLDLMMPRVDGWQVVSRLRADESFALVPILLLTAGNEPDDRVAAFKLGADDYISKPFRPAELQIRVTRALRNRAQLSYFAGGLKRARPSLPALEIEPMESIPPTAPSESESA
jgi:two-component system response regulator ResD